MISLDSGDKVQGDASAATVVDYTLYGLDNNAIKQLADGQLAAATGDLFTADSADVVTTIILVNTDTSARTINLFLLPSGGTARRIIPKDMSLGVGYCLITDGGKIGVYDASGNLQQTVTVVAHDLGGASHAADTLANLNTKVSDATLVDSADTVLKALFDAYTILAADTDNTPAAIALAASQLIGRKATGGIVALTAADIFTILGITASAAELNTLDGILATVTELNYVDGVTSAIQTQLDAKIANALLTTLGDIIRRGASAPERLGIGSAGQVLTVVSGEPAWAAAAAGATLVHKTADETVNNSDTLQNDDALLMAVAANEKWIATLFLVFQGTADSDLKVTFTVPSGATGYFGLEGGYDDTYAFAAPRTVNLAGSDEYCIRFQVVVINSTNAGNLQFQWAQNTAIAEDTKVKANSILVAHEIV